MGFFFWIAITYMMADVMGHGGDGDGEPPPRGFGGPSHHQQDSKFFKIYLFDKSLL